MFFSNGFIFNGCFSRLSDVSYCKWSGGFRIDQDDSFHVNMRYAKSFQSSAKSSVPVIQFVGIS